MKTKTLKQFIQEEKEDSGLIFMGTIEEEVANTMSNPEVKKEYFNIMVKRFTKIQDMGKISGLVINDDSISYN